jgi:hypothetical protein
MRAADYAALGGHVAQVRPTEAVLAEARQRTLAPLPGTPWPLTPSG